ncbi:MAG: hypothetical protein KGJ86_17485, partial [Chloroflexota bacterium]|nr:hypothetical protein [Chloroflexota bacterium]
MLTLLSKAGGDRFEHRQPSDLGRLVEDEHCLFWLDVEASDARELSVLDEVFHFHPLTIEDSSNDVIDPPKVDDYGD